MRTLLLGATILLVVPSLLDACFWKDSDSECDRLEYQYDYDDCEDRASDLKKESQAFADCDEDNEDGLTWEEVSHCIVSHVNYFVYLNIQYSKLINQNTT